MATDGHHAGICIASARWWHNRMIAMYSIRLDGDPDIIEPLFCAHTVKIWQTCKSDMRGRLQRREAEPRIRRGECERT
eukprot:8241937-Pyramimonas_sp.AAC.1